MVRTQLRNVERDDVKTQRLKRSALRRAAELVLLDVDGKVRAGGVYLPLSTSHDQRAEGYLLAEALCQLADGSGDLMEIMRPGVRERATADTEIPMEEP